MGPPSDISSSRCTRCGGAGPTRTVHLHRHIGAILLFFHTRIRGLLCKPCLDVVFRETFFITLFAGWWGWISFFATAFFVPFDLASYLLTRASYGSVETPSSASTRTALSVVAGALPLVGFLCGGPYLLLAGLDALLDRSYGTYSDERGGWVAAGGEQVTHPCNGDVSPTAPAFDATQPIRATGYTRMDEGLWMTNDDYLPEGWSDRPDVETPVVVCVEAERTEIIERCDDVGATRTTYPRDVRVLEARTGRELGRITVTGADPPGPCPATGISRPVILSGARVQATDVRAALAHFHPN